MEFQHRLDEMLIEHAVPLLLAFGADPEADAGMRTARTSWLNSVCQVDT